MAITNPAKIGYEKASAAYSNDQGFYHRLTVGSTIATGGLAFASLFLLVFVSLFAAMFTAPLAIVAGATTARRVNFLTNRTEKYCVTVSDLPTKVLGNMFNELTEVGRQYRANLAAVDPSLRSEVEIDEEMLNQRMWEISQHLLRLQGLYNKDSSDGDSRITKRTSDAVQKAMTDIRIEIEKLQDAIQDLSDLTVLSVTSSIHESYVDPTAGDSLKFITKTRLGAHKELMAGPSEEGETEAPKDTGAIAM